MAAKLKKGDRVIVVAGGNKTKTNRDINGKRGEIVRVIPDENKAVVGGLNMAIHNEKQTQSAQGGRIPREQAIDLSNLMLEDPKTGEPTRVGFKILDDGKKVRVAKKSGEVIEEKAGK